MKRARPPRACTVTGCGEPIKRGMVMCRAHWFATPRPLRDAITSTRAAHRPADYSANLLAAREYHFQNSPASLAARITGEAPCES